MISPKKVQEPHWFDQLCPGHPHQVQIAILQIFALNQFHVNSTSRHHGASQAQRERGRKSASVCISLKTATSSLSPFPGLNFHEFLNTFRGPKPRREIDNEFDLAIFRPCIQLLVACLNLKVVGMPSGLRMISEVRNEERRLNREAGRDWAEPCLIFFAVLPTQH